MQCNSGLGCSAAKANSARFSKESRLSTFSNFSSIRITSMSSWIVEHWCFQLESALEKKDKRGIKSLLQDIQNPRSLQNPLRVAIKTDHPILIQGIMRLLQRVPDLSSAQIASLLVRAGCPLENVVPAADFALVKEMIERGASLDMSRAVSPHDWVSSPLHAAVEDGDNQLAVAELMIKHGSPVNANDSLFYTPLHKTVENRNSYQMVKLLLENGASVNSCNTCKYTPLLTAIRFDQSLDVVRLLVENGADVKARGVLGNGVLHYAADNSRQDLLDYFFEKGVEPNERNAKNETVLHTVFRTAELDFVRFLLERGVDPSAKNNDQNSVLHTLFRSVKFYMGFSKLKIRDPEKKLRLCFDYGADVNDADAKGHTILVLSHLESNFWAKPILEQIAKVEALGQPVSKIDCKIIKNNRFCGDYYDKCRKELQAMREKKFYQEVSMFNMLTMSHKRMQCYVRNEELVEAFEKEECDCEFPIYMEFTRERFKHILAKQELIEKTVDVLAEVMGPVGCYDYFIQKIVSYLNENDLLRLIGD